MSPKDAEFFKQLLALVFKMWFLWRAGCSQCICCQSDIWSFWTHICPDGKNPNFCQFFWNSPGVSSEVSSKDGENLKFLPALVSAMQIFHEKGAVEWKYSLSARLFNSFQSKFTELAKIRILGIFCESLEIFRVNCLLTTMKISNGFLIYFQIFELFK